MKRNVLHFILDDLSPEHTRLPARTPHMDGLAARGVRFGSRLLPVCVVLPIPPVLLHRPQRQRFARLRFRRVEPWRALAARAPQTARLGGLGFGKLLQYELRDSGRAIAIVRDERTRSARASVHARRWERRRTPTSNPRSTMATAVRRVWDYVQQPRPRCALRDAPPPSGSISRRRLPVAWCALGASSRATSAPPSIASSPTRPRRQLRLLFGSAVSRYRKPALASPTARRRSRGGRGTAERVLAS